MGTTPEFQPHGAGITGLYQLEVKLLSRASAGDVGGGLGGSFGGGGLKAQYYANARLAGRPLVTRVRTTAVDRVLS